MDGGYAATGDLAALVELRAPPRTRQYFAADGIGQRGGVDRWCAFGMADSHV